MSPEDGSIKRVMVGGSFHLDFLIKNSGDYSPEGYVTVLTSSEYLKVTSVQSLDCDATIYRPNQDPVWYYDGRHTTYHGYLVDGVRIGVKKDDYIGIEVKFQAEREGTYYIYWRSALDTRAQGYDWVRNPTSGSKDPLGYFAYKMRVEVTSNTELSVKVHNVDSLPLPGAGGKIRVEIWDGENKVNSDTKSYLGGEEYITFSFSLSENRNYRIKVYQIPEIGMGYEEYWGHQDIYVGSSPTDVDFYRNMPYVYSVPSQYSLTLGDSVYPKVILENPGQSISTRVKLFIDRDKVSPYDYEELSSQFSIGQNSQGEVTLTEFRPSEVGTYYHYAIAYAYVDNEWRVTDQTVWPEETPFANVEEVPNHNPTISLFTPADGASITGDTLTLIWSASDPDGDSLRYDLYLGGTTDPPLYVSGLTANFYTPILPPGVYYWKVVAKDQKGGVANSQIWSFTVLANRAPVAGFVISSSTIELGETLIFDASQSYDPDGDQITYKWQITPQNLPPVIYGPTGEPIAQLGFTYESSEPLLKYLPELPGTYSVTLVVEDNEGKSTSLTKEVEVKPVSGYPEPQRINYILERIDESGVYILRINIYSEFPIEIDTYSGINAKFDIYQITHNIALEDLFKAVTYETAQSVALYALGISVPLPISLVSIALDLYGSYYEGKAFPIKYDISNGIYNIEVPIKTATATGNIASLISPTSTSADYNFILNKAIEDFKLNFARGEVDINFEDLENPYFAIAQNGTKLPSRMEGRYEKQLFNGIEFKYEPKFNPSPNEKPDINVYYIWESPLPSHPLIYSYAKSVHNYLYSRGFSDLMTSSLHPSRFIAIDPTYTSPSELCGYSDFKAVTVGFDPGCENGVLQSGWSKSVIKETENFKIIHRHNEVRKIDIMAIISKKQVTPESVENSMEEAVQYFVANSNLILPLMGIEIKTLDISYISSTVYLGNTIKAKGHVNVPSIADATIQWEFGGNNILLGGTAPINNDGSFTVKIDTYQGWYPDLGSYTLTIKLLYNGDVIAVENFPIEIRRPTISVELPSQIQLGDTLHITIRTVRDGEYENLGDISGL